MIHLDPHIVSSLPLLSLGLRPRYLKSNFLLWPLRVIFQSLWPKPSLQSEPVRVTSPKKLVSLTSHKFPDSLSDQMKLLLIKERVPSFHRRQNKTKNFKLYRGTAEEPYYNKRLRNGKNYRTLHVFDFITLLGVTLTSPLSSLSSKPNFTKLR